MTSLRRLGRLAARWPALVLAIVVGSCATSPETSSGNYGAAAVTAGTAAVAWAAVGCTVNGCEPPFRCNGETKQCERIPCGEGVGSCPPAFQCDPEDHLCK